MTMTARRAAAIGEAALARLAERPELLGRFLIETGASPAEALARAEDPAFLAHVLEFVARDEAEAEAFCRAEGLTPERFAAARAALPGGDDPHWT